MARIDLRTGSEGPKHDPYHYDEITFVPTNRRRKKVVLHMGLGEWCTIGKRRVHGAEKACIMFTRATGLRPGQAMKAYRYVHEVLPYKQHAMKCDGIMDNVSGYPGETFDHCPKCGFVAGYHMNWSAVE